MKFALSSTVFLMAKYVYKRPDNSQLQFVLRVPEDLLHCYPKSSIRYSLKTDDPALAAKRGDAAYARHQAEFARLRDDSTLTPAQLNTLAQEKAKELGSLQHDDAQDYFQDKLHACKPRPHSQRDSMTMVHQDLNRATWEFSTSSGP